MISGEILAGVLPLVGVVLGAGLQFLLSRSLEAGKQLKVQKGQAYADYFQALALAATKGKSPEVSGLAADAKTRICIYGSPAVVRKLGEFQKTGAIVASAESKAAIAELLREMRADMDGRAHGLDEEALHWTLFGPSPK